MMDERRLAEIEARHVDDGHGTCQACTVQPYGVEWPCDAAQLAAEARRLRVKNDDLYRDLRRANARINRDAEGG